jgi:hypothetical protein
MPDPQGTPLGYIGVATAFSSQPKYPIPKSQEQKSE